MGTRLTVLYVTYKQEALDLRREVELYREGQEEPFVFKRLIVRDIVTGYESKRNGWNVLT